MNKEVRVVDAWVQPWPAEAVSAMPRRNFGMAERFAHGRRLLQGISVKEMVAEMDAAGIDLALCSAGPLIPNHLVEVAVTEYPDRFVGIASVDPWSPDGVMPAVRELRRLVQDCGFKGLKLEPFINDKLPTEAQWYPLYAECAELDITLQVQVGGTGPATYTSETGRPGHIDRIAIDFPELRIVAGHIGWPWTEEMIAVATKHPNVWIDTSAHLPKYYPAAFVHFLRTFGRRKCIWASDWPILEFAPALTGVNDFGLSDDVHRMFLRDNAIEAFRLDV
ncbi:amidohydrolase family protein [Nocardia sp. NPDC052278]|uniref:amidohydrolase family protein n=1 Tax=unclassified Nocardia TaxID=2637762 RepID=UPI0036A1984E